MLSQEVRDKLNAKIPREAVATREGGGRSSLSYLEGHYVINRLNDAFGQGNWSYEVEEMRLVHSGQTDGKYGPVSSAHYIAKVRLALFGDKEAGKAFREAVTFSDFGYGDGSDKANIGKAHELACKEAVTDGVKRCAKNLGMSMGLALYDKTQKNVDDAGESRPAANAAPKAAPSVVKAPAQVRPAPAAVSSGTAPVASAPQATAPKPLDAEIKSGVRVVLAKKLKTLEELKTYVRTTYGVESTDSLDDTKKQEVLAYLQNLANN